MNSSSISPENPFYIEEHSGLLRENVDHALNSVDLAAQSAVNNNSNTATIKLIPSPNYDERPQRATIDLLVIHNISIPKGIFDTETIAAFFCNKLDRLVAAKELNRIDPPELARLINLKVSAHLSIGRAGAIIQYVPFTKRAWHAGESKFAGRANCNDFSIGIELEGADDIPYTTEQYEQLARVTQALMRAYPNITLSRIVGHSDIAPQRKTDPGAAFAWDLYRSLVKVGGL